MTGDHIAQVVVAAGGLGTRAASWARFIPKEFYPVDGRPGLVHLLEEIATFGPARVVVVYHPYYEQFAAWARQMLSETGQARYTRLTGQPAYQVLPAGQLISFLPQRGPYADLTSVINGADHLGSRDELHVAFADNLYRGPSPLLALQGSSPGQVTVLASRYRPELAASHGVIAAIGTPGRRHMIGLTEKPDPAEARALERRYGTGNLLLLEGRARLTAAFVDFTRIRISTARTEPKLALTIEAYAASHPVRIVETSADVIDLGALAAPDPGDAASSRSARLTWACGMMTTAAPGGRHSSG
jgi:UTP-glucose-1-phosphate uridylyltransferase